MTDHNARQAGLTDEQILDIVKRSPAFDTAEQEWLYVCRAILAAHSADAHNGEVDQEWRAVLSSLIGSHGGTIAVSPSDDRAIRARALLAAPAAPAPTTRDEIEARQRAAMKTRFAGRPTSPATADFDLPAPNDAAPAPAAQADDREQFETWAKDHGHDVLRAPSWKNTDYQSLPCEDAWRGWKGAIAQQSATPAPAAQKPLGYIIPQLLDTLAKGGDIVLWPRPMGTATMPVYGSPADAASEADKWKLRFETLSALHEYKPSMEELDIAIDAAVQRERQQGARTEPEGGK